MGSSLDQISSLNPVPDALRRQLAENIERLRNSGKLSLSSRDAAAEQSAAQAGDLDAILRHKLSALDPSSPEGQAQTTCTFVETVLAAEFGEALRSDPGFNVLLGEISASLREDPQLREHLDSMLIDL